MVHAIKVKVRSFIERLTRSEEVIFNQGKILSSLHASREIIPELSSVEWKAFSQWGEDGIIDWLAANVVNIPNTFIEFGVENYKESNTRMLLKSRNWRGLIMDGSSSHIQDIRSQSIYWQHDIIAVHHFIDCANINEIIATNGFIGEVGILSIDIDGNDYWIWDSINVISPVIVVCEYNAVLGNKHAISIPYDPAFMRKNAHHSRMYYGASIAALIHLADQKGYRFLGTNAHGSSGFFIRNDHAKKILQRIENITAYPSRFSEARDTNGNLTFLRKNKRSHIISHLPVVLVAEDKQCKISELGELNTESWDI